MIEKLQKRVDKLERKLKNAKEVHNNVLQSYQAEIESVQEALKKMMTIEQEVISHIPQPDFKGQDRESAEKTQQDIAARNLRYLERTRTLLDFGFKYADFGKLNSYNNDAGYYLDYEDHNEHRFSAKITCDQVREYPKERWDYFINKLNKTKVNEPEPITTDNTIMYASFNRRSELIPKEGYRFVIKDGAIKVRKQ